MRDDLQKLNTTNLPRIYSGEQILGGAKEARGHCLGCGEWVSGETNPDWICRSCERRYPPSLLKAVSDPFDYVLRLRTGELIYFETAAILGEWVTLTLKENSRTMEPSTMGKDCLPCPRGLDVRVRDIVWCADAPMGS